MVDSDPGSAGIDLKAVREDARAAVNEALGGEDHVAEDPDIEEADVEHARGLVLGKGLETTDFIRFRSFLLEDGYEPDEIEQLWAILRNEDAIPKGSRESFDSTAEAGEDDGPAHEHGGDGGRVDDAAALEAAAEGAEAVYLLKTASCPTCIQAERALDAWVEDGLVTPLNFPEAALAEDIVDELDIREVPTLVAEAEDGQFRRL